MSLWLERKYVNLLSPQLRNFKWTTENTARCSCPICGDSKTDKHKARFYFFQKNSKYFVYCHNCGASTTFINFMKNKDVELHEEYVKEMLMEKMNEGVEKPKEKLDFRKPKFLSKNSILASLRRVSQLENDHRAKIFVLGRKIPTHQHYRLFYAPKFNEWVNSIIPDKLPKDFDEPRLVIPFIDKQGEVFAFQGRALKPNSKQRYITIFLDEDRPKVYGLDVVDRTKKHYVVEGPIDSLFIPNCLAMGGADIPYSELNKHSVMVYDNQPRNREVIKKIEKAIEKKVSVVIWPENIKAKDINDMVLEGMTPEEILGVLETNTYTYLEAELKLMEWKKI